MQHPSSDGSQPVRLLPAHRPSPPPDASLDLGLIGRAIWSQKWIVLGSLLVVAGAAVAYSLTATPIYESSSIVAVDTNQKSGGGGVMFGETRVLTAEVGVLRNSLELAERVAGRLAEPAQPDSAALDGIALDGTSPDSMATSTTAPMRDAGRLLQRVRFEPLAAEDMIRISVEGTDPVETAAIANAYATEYEAFSRETSRARIVAARRAIEAQVIRRGDELAQLENEWVSTAQRGRSAGQGLAGEQLAQEYAATRSARGQTITAREQQRRSLAMLRAQLTEAEAALPGAVQRERDVAGLQAQADALDTYIAEQTVRAEEFYAVRPELRGNEQEDQRLADIANRIEHLQERKGAVSEQIARSQLSAAADGADGGHLGYVVGLRREVAETETELRSLEAQANALGQRAGSVSASVLGIPRQALTRERLEHRRAQMEQWYTTAVDRLLETVVAEEEELGYVSLVRQARPPALPVRPDTELNIILGLLLGLGVGMGLAFARESADHRYRQPEDIENGEHTLLGVIPRIPPALMAPPTDGLEEEQTQVVSLLHPWSPVAEHYRLLRTRLEYAAAASGLQVLLVTSPEAGDGKSVTAVNLAAMLARNGHRTLLIDADMRRPTGHKLLGVATSPGLGELLAGQSQFHPEQVVTSVMGLSFIPAGRTHFPPSECLGSPIMRSLLTAARQHYDFILIDSPPVLAAADAVTLAPLCDAALAVASAGRTDRRKLKWTLEAIEGVGVPVSGVVLTRYKAKRKDTYHTNYGQYYAEDFPASN